MHKVTSQPTPQFVEYIKNGLKYWLTQTIDLDASSIKKIDPERDNLFLILDFGLQLPELWDLTSALIIQSFPLPDRRGYLNLWLEKLTSAIAGAPKRPSSSLVRLQIHYGKLLRSLSQLDEAIKAHQIAIHAAENIKDDTLLSLAQMEMGWDYLWQDDLDNAQLFGEEALQKYEANSNGLVVQWVDTFRLLGVAETRRGNVDQAIKLLKKALRGAQKIKNPIVLARTYSDLGIAYQRKKSIPDAMDCFGKAAEALLRTSYEWDKVTIFLNIGALYFDQEMWEAAEAAFLKIDRQHLRFKTKAILWNNLGNVYCKQGKLEDAENYLEDALALWSKIGNEIEWANTLVSLAEVFIEQGRYVEAEGMIKEVIGKVEKYPENAWGRQIKSEAVQLAQNANIDQKLD